MQNLILGTIVNYTWEDIEPFFSSYFKNSSTNVDCTVFVKKISKRTRKYLENYNIEIINIDDEYNEDWITEYRWRLYNEYLNHCCVDYANVLLVDVRDSFFQDNIFERCNGKKILFSKEVNDFANEKCNREWIERRYGINVINSIKDYYPICAGTIIGDFNYIKNLCENVVENMDNTSYEYFKNCDQSIVNYLVYYKKIFIEDDIYWEYACDNNIATVGLLNELTIKSNEVVNKDNYIPALIHQYDRHKILVKFVERKYCKRKGMVIRSFLKYRYLRAILKRTFL